MIVHKKRRIIDIIKPFFTMGDVQRTFSLLWPFIIRHWRAYLFLLLIMFIDIFITLAFAWFFGNITDAAIQSNFDRMKWLIPLGASLILISIVSTFCNIYFESISTNGVKRDLKDYLFKHIVRLPARNASNLRSGELASHFTNDINSITGVIGSSLIDLIRLPFIFIAVFLYLLHINWKLALISLFIAPIAIFAGVFFGLLLRRNGRLIHNLVGNMNNFLNESFLGFFVIRSFTMEKLLFKKYVAQNQKLFSLELENAKLRGWFYSGGQFVSSLTYLVSLCLGAYYVSNGVMSVGSLLMFVTLVNHLVYPLTGLAGQWAGFQRSVTAVERVLKVLEQPTDSTDLPSYTPSIKHLTSIQFQNITFSYDENKKVFDHFNLEIPAGKVIAIVGPSGAGKSTLFNLLQGFYKPQSGAVLVDGISTEEFSLSELRSAIAHVPQETFLFAGTIRENLLLARPNITELEIVNASKNANIHDFIMSLTDGYDTEIGERGIKLSGGQKQRVAIARAILKDAPILLLDEATSALDNETEFHVKEALDLLMKDRTTIVIAHRLSTIHNADLIIVLDKGKIVQMGGHEELLNMNGLYQNLHQTPSQTKKPESIFLVSK